MEANKYFTLNVVTAEIAAAAHQTSARYASEVSEFQACHLTEEYVDGFFAPAVKESPLQIGLSLFQVVPMEINDTKLVIAKVEWIRLQKELILEDGNLDFSSIQAMNVLGLENYYQATFDSHRPYAKV
jgi:flavin reductase (DIM6/NTAB) family NADH-FMN oxidoreductase RutF